MEIATMLGVGAAGSYLHKNERRAKKKKRVKIPVRDIPNGMDVYNQNNLGLSEEKMRNTAERLYYNSLDPEQTNIVPTYYNQLDPIMKKIKNAKDFKMEKQANLYNPEDDIDDIYQELQELRPTKRNDIYKKNYLDRKEPLLEDMYQESIRNKKKPKQNPYFSEDNFKRDIEGKVKKDPRKVIEGFRQQENFRTIEKDLLNASEQITDNAVSIQKILNLKSKKPKVKKGFYQRMQIPEDEMFAKYPHKKEGRYYSEALDMEVGAEEFDEDEPVIFKRRTLRGEVLGVGNPKGIHNTRDRVADMPSYLYQFDEMTYDNNGIPGAQNDIFDTSNGTQPSDLEQQISYDGGWTQYDKAGSMTYGVVPEDDMSHNNMIPFFREKSGYGSNDFLNYASQDRKNELFTGNLTTEWRKKEEVRPHFEPSGNQTFIYGAPVRPEEEETRFIPSLYRQNERLFDPTRVTPGLNLKPGEIGTQGNFDLYRAMPKTVDELRTADKPRVTYEGRIIEGLKGSEGPVQAPVERRRPDSYRVMKEGDLLPKSDLNTGPRAVENFIMKETNRAETSVEYTGGAYNRDEAVDQCGPESMRPLVKFSTRQNYKLPTPLQKYAKDQNMYNANLGSYEDKPNARSETGPVRHWGAAYNVTGSQAYANPQDVARATVKETQLFDTMPYTVVKDMTMRGTVHNMDQARPTVRETTSVNTVNPTANVTYGQQRVYHQDDARTTIRETTEDAIQPANIMEGAGPYANWSDDARTTTKETTVHIPYQTVTTAVNQGQGQTPYQDVMRTTIRETTEGIPQQTMFTPVDQGQGSRHYTDVARTTIRETTEGIPQQTMFTPINRSQGKTPLQDVMRTTIRETTEGIPQQTMATPINQGQGSSQSFNWDPLRTTIKETTVLTPWNTMMTPVNQDQGQTPYQDIMRTTIRETTEGIPQQSMMTPVNQGQGQTPYQDIMRTTIRETTEGIPQQTMFTPVDQGQGSRHYTDVARTTIRETTEGIPQQTMFTPVDQGQGSRHYTDVARTTIRETTEAIPQQTMINQTGRGTTTPYQDIARTTTKEQTSQIPYQTMIGQTGRGSKTPYQDVARTTIKEGTVQIPYETFISQTSRGSTTPYQDIARTTTKEQTSQIPWQTMVSQTGRGSTTPYQDVARTTIKEGTVQIPHQTFVGQSGRGAKTPLQDIARGTLKEQTSQIPYQTMVAQTSRGSTTPYQDIARTTMKEQTSQIPWQTVVSQTGRGSTTPYQDVARTTIKEGTVQIPYQTVVSQTSRGSKTPLQDIMRTTTKEGTVVIPYQTMVSQTGRGSTTPYQDVARGTIKETTAGITRNTHAFGVNQGQGQTPLQDIARGTIKETTVVIPYQTQLTAVNQGQGQTPLQDTMRTTIRELTENNTYLSNNTKTAANGSGYGYMANPQQAYNTNRQFTGQEVYIGPAGNSEGLRTYDDAYNAHLNEKREAAVNFFRPFTDANYDVGPAAEYMHLYNKKDDNRSLDPIRGSSVNIHQDRMMPQMTVTMGNRHNVESEMYVDPVVLKQLKTNPYSGPTYYGGDYATDNRT